LRVQFSTELFLERRERSQMAFIMAATLQREIYALEYGLTTLNPAAQVLRQILTSPKTGKP